MFLDIKLGILWAFLLGVIFSEPFTLGWFLLGIVFALLPDLDFWIEYAKRGTVGGTVLGAHRTLFHNPLPYLLIATLVLYFFGTAWATMGHLIHDTAGMGFGVRWLWPFSKKLYKVFSDKEGGIHYDMAHLKITSWDPEEIKTLVREKGNDSWLAEDIRYHVKHLPEQVGKFIVLGMVMVLVYIMTLRFL